MYYKLGGPKIEVHWALTDHTMFKGGSLEEKGIWERAREVEVLGVNTLTLGYSDFIFHLIVHMASHVAYHGFGIRYLVDLLVMIEQQGKRIDWHEVIKLIDKYQIRKFSAGIFSCCEDLFGLKLPDEVAQLAVVDSDYLTLFEDEIMNRGVDGYRESSEVLSRQISYNNKKQLSPLQKMLNLFFPPIDEMSDKYDYAKKNKILAPIARIHHLFVGLLDPKYSFKDKFKLMTSGYQTVKKRADMIKWLELEWILLVIIAISISIVEKLVCLLWLYSSLSFFVTHCLDSSMGKNMSAFGLYSCSKSSDLFSLTKAREATVIFVSHP